MAAVDYLPHGLVTALAGIVGYVFNEHVKTDAARFTELKADISSLDAKLDAHYAEITRLLIAAQTSRAEAAEARARHAGP